MQGTSEAATVAAPIAAGSGWSVVVSEVLAAVLGVPLAVVIAAAAGAVLAKHATQVALWHDLLRRALWVIIGCVAAQGIGSILSMWSANPAQAPSAGLLGFLAFLTAGLGPTGWPKLLEFFPLILRGLVKRWVPEALPPDPPQPPDAPTGGSNEPRA